MIRSLFGARTRFYVLAAAVAQFTLAAGCNTSQGDSEAAEQSALYVDTATAERLDGYPVRDAATRTIDVILDIDPDNGALPADLARLVVAGVYADGLQPPERHAHQNNRFSMASDITRYSSVMMLPTRMKSLTR